jgi:predicted DNA-binding protein YlxM (UPF0122 family)
VIAEAIGVKIDSVRTVLAEAGVIPARSDKRHKGGSGKPFTQHVDLTPHVDDIIRAYLVDRRSMADIGKQYGVNRKKIGTVLRNAGAEIRTEACREIGPSGLLAREHTAAIIRMYEDDLASMSNIARHFVVSGPTVRRVLTDAGVSIRRRRVASRLFAKRVGTVLINPPAVDESGPRSHQGKKRQSETIMSSMGYPTYSGGKYANRPVHAVLMEQNIGRPLRPDEIVHHIDEDKLNNNLNNLALMTTGAHQRLHWFQDQLAGIVRDRAPDGTFMPISADAETMGAVQ